MVYGGPHEFVPDAGERDLEKNLGEDVRIIVHTFDVMDASQIILTQV